MSEPFEFPSTSQQTDPHGFNVWLAMTLQRMDIKLDTVASLQQIANGRTGKLEDKIKALESEHIKHAGVIAAVEKAFIAVLTVSVTGLLAAIGTWIYSGGLVR